MGFMNTKAKLQGQRGFTIVELLIVVVVIAILAAITIVSYNGITNRANASASESLVATWRKKIELYQAEQTTYPLTSANLSGDTTKSFYIPSSSLSTTDPVATTGTDKVRVLACAASGSTAPTTNAGVSAVKIIYWDYDKSGGAGTDAVIIGTTSITGTTVTGCVNL